MEQVDIRITNAIVHIMDSRIGMPILSDVKLEHDFEVGDFVRGHIHRIASGDDIKSGSFDKEDSKIYGLLENWDDENFISVSQEIAKHLYTIMNQHIEIPPADLMIVTYRTEQHPYMAVLKLNYKTSYTHLTHEDPWGKNNDIIKQKAMIPGERENLSEAALIDLEDKSIYLKEKKYDVNGIKTNYFSSLFLQCKSDLSPKMKLSIVTKAIEVIQKKYYNESEQFEAQMEAKSIINQELTEKGSLDIPVVLDKLFKDKAEMKEDIQENIEKYNLTDSSIVPQNPNTIKKFERQHLMTDTGIELKIPMEEYQNEQAVEFITNQDGSITIILKNIGSIISK